MTNDTFTFYTIKFQDADPQYLQFDSVDSNGFLTFQNESKQPFVFHWHDFFDGDASLVRL